MSKSKTASLLINAKKRVNLGSIPLFVHFGHQGLEKGNPTPTSKYGAEQTFIVPKDILKMSISDPSIYEDIESIEFTYTTVKGN